MKHILTALTATAALCTASHTAAFDTGPHAYATYRALKHAGFSETAIEIVQVSNWLTDYYSSDPAKSTLAGYAAKLHFDNLGTHSATAAYWQRLLDNYHFELRDEPLDTSLSEKDRALYVLVFTGITLHAIQDFYTHSNWPDYFPKTGDAYRDETYLSVGMPAEGTVNPLRTGVYADSADDTATVSGPDHGDYDTGVNKDSHIRPNWDQSYVFAYLESARLIDMAEEILNDDTIWSAAQNMSDNDIGSSNRNDLDQDLDAMWSISQFIDFGSEDGHWNGNKSGSNTDFGIEYAEWLSGDDSFIKDMFDGDTDDVAQQMAKCLYQTTTCDRAGGNTFFNDYDPGHSVVHVRVSEVVANEWFPDAQTPPDFFARMNFQDDYMIMDDRVLYDISSWYGKDHDGKVTTLMPPNSAVTDSPRPDYIDAYWAIYFTHQDPVDIEIQLWDYDQTSSNDHADISGNGNNLDLSYSMSRDAFQVEGGDTWHTNTSHSDTYHADDGDDASLRLYISDAAIGN